MQATLASSSVSLAPPFTQGLPVALRTALRWAPQERLPASSVESSGATQELPASTRPRPALDAASLGAYTADMRRFARRRVRDVELAEDAVQDALLAALGSMDGFRGQSTLRTWLFGILTHKIQDTFRREVRYVRESTQAFEDEDAPASGASESWARLATSSVDDPLARLASRRLIERVVEEVEALPDSLKQVFIRQAIQEEPTADVCQALGISEANCWVRLHRARKRLSERLVDHR